MLEKWREIYKFEQNGWFNYSDLYNMIIEKYPIGTFVEIGVWQGMSLSYLILKSGNKNIWGVDTFKGDPNNPNEQRIIKDNNLNLLEETMKNFRILNIPPKLIIKDSIEAAKDFRDNTCSFIFIDGGHTYEQVCKDIEAWKIKVRKGGTLAGHDIDAPGVKRAVEESFPNYKIMGSCWYIEI